MDLVLDSPPDSSLKTGQRLLWIATGILWLILFWPSLMSMAAIWWRSETYAHGMLILPISIWLIYRRREWLTRVPARPCWWAIPLVLLSFLLWFAAKAADLLVIEQLATLSTGLALVLLLIGWPRVRLMLFPLGYLIFAVPFGEELTPWLQQVTADITVAALRWSGIPVYVNGLFIEIPSGRFEVAEACSGIRYLISSLAVGTLYGYLTFATPRKRLLFALAALLVPILANGIRAYLIIIIAYLSDMRYATGIDHLIYGWVFFGLVMLLLFWLGSFWRDREVSFNPRINTRDQATKSGPAADYAAASLATGLLILGLWTNARFEERSLSTSARQLAPLEIPHSSLWPILPDASPWSPNFINPDRTLMATFGQNASQRIDLYIVDYLRESQDKELINALNRFFPRPWVLASSDERLLQLDTISLPVRTLELRHPGGGRRLVWYWYQVEDQFLNDSLRVKLVQAFYRLWGSEPLSRAVVLSVPVKPQENEQGHKHLIAFIRDHQQLLTDIALDGNP